MKIYNTRALTRTQRFQKAVLFAIPSTFGIAIVLGFALRLMPIQFEIMFLAVGYGIGYVIRNFGKGVQARFSVLGAVCAFSAILMADAIALAGIGGMLNPMIWMFVIMSYFSTLGSLWGILGILFRIAAISVAYEQSRIV